ncbi:hypothetical protein ACFFRR_007377 [Megaselia abdita]
MSFCFIQFLIAIAITSVRCGEVEFTILHNNDLHARFDEISASLGACTDALKNSSSCFGGFARAAHVIRDARKEAAANGKPVFYFFAGDIFTGTEWFTIFRMEICTTFLNILSPDVWTIGNHEFDDGGVDGLAKFVKSIRAPAVIANADFKKDIGTKKSVILNAKNQKVGIIGAITSDIKQICDFTGDSIFEDEIKSINMEAEALQKQGVEIIIALTHCGYEVDKKIAEKCPLVDLVIGSHSHSFLNSGRMDPIHPESKAIEGPYPTMIEQPGGKKVPVVQAYAYSKYIGKFDLKVR